MDICIVVGQNIRRLRKGMRMSQDELAHKAGIDRSYLSEVENGQKNVGISIIAYIARALDVKITDIFGGYK